MPSRRRALVVGIDDYPAAPLDGCVNDAEAMRALLERHDDGSPNFDVKLVTSENESVTRASLRSAIETLLSFDDAEVALLYFSGHGTENDFDGYLVTPDATSYDEGVALSEVLARANASRAQEVVIILDSCMSGALGNVPQTQSPHAPLREGVALLTSSRSGQVSVEVGGRGLFTELVRGALEGGAADVLGQVTVASIYAYVEEALGPWEQRPLFKAHVSKLVPLRVVDPAVDMETLRMLPELFSDPDATFPLDPSFEITEEPSDPDNEATFELLQACRAAKLVEPIAERHMYFAAMNSTGCKLTPLGRRYWRMASEGRL